MVSSKYHFRCVWSDMSVFPKITILLFLRNIFREKWVMQLIFCMQLSMKASFKLILWFWWRWSSIPEVPKITSLQCLYNISIKKLDEVDFLHVDKEQSFLQVDFNTLGIKVFYKVILSLLMDMIYHSQSTQSKILQYLYNISKKKLGMQPSFFMQRSIKTSTSWHYRFWWI